MNKKIQLFTILLFFLVIEIFFSVYKPAEALTLSSCQPINESGTYYLTADITDQDGNCFEIQTSNV
ncbi:MAG: hypothetical protein GXN99_02140, partial [Candidatus Nanohaloarchaeota archaeon]|nr:hypothetical protein [Candidatus Nanohaloarchaeota archaeon]